MNEASTTFHRKLNDEIFVRPSNRKVKLSYFLVTGKNASVEERGTLKVGPFSTSTNKKDPSDNRVGYGSIGKAGKIPV